MTQRFIVALTREARRSGQVIDLVKLLAEASDEIHVLERAISGKSVTVEMPVGYELELRKRLPFAIVEPAGTLSLL